MVSVLGRRLLGVAVGLGADRIMGDPPDMVHPVAWFGRAMGWAERRLWVDGQLAGVGLTGAGLLAAFSAGAGLRASGPFASAALGTAMCSAGRSLGLAAVAVEGALRDGDLVLARDRLRAIVGRDVAGLDSVEVARAAVESVAENTVDAVVAPAFWAAVGGAPGALGYRAVNTLDAMVGYRDDRYRQFGWASARADDLANWIPARLTAAATALCCPSAARSVWRAVRDQAPAHPSPNAGVAEAAFAAALGVTLGGPSTYSGQVEHRPLLGTGRPPAASDIRRAVRLSGEVTAVVGSACVAGSVALGRRRVGRL